MSFPGAVLELDSLPNASIMGCRGSGQIHLTAVIFAV